MLMPTARPAFFASSTRRPPDARAPCIVALPRRSRPLLAETRGRLLKKVPLFQAAQLTGRIKPNNIHSTGLGWTVEGSPATHRARPRQPRDTRRPIRRIGPRWRRPPGRRRCSFLTVRSRQTGQVQTLNRSLSKILLPPSIKLYCNG